MWAQYKQKMSTITVTTITITNLVLVAIFANIGLININGLSEASQSSASLSDPVNSLFNTSRLAIESNGDGQDNKHSRVKRQISRANVAKCFVDRGPNFTKPPAVHFFASKRHSAATRDCGPNIEVKLEPMGGKMTLHPQLNTAQIKELLIESKLFDPNVPTYFITHGFQSSWNQGTWACTIKDLVLDNSGANVFVVDWSGGSKPPVPLDYGLSVSNTPYVGAILNQFIRTLIGLSGQQDASQYHMIGHSLGAHISGFTGYYLGGTLGRITALDPAGPCFESGSKTDETALEDGYLDSGSRRLSRQSAKLVVALHTDAATFGLKQSCAHYDVYVNGGYEQPECQSTQQQQQESQLTGILGLNLQEFVSHSLPCNHAYAHRLFVDLHNFLSRRGSSVRLEHRDDECYPIAYQCSNWDAFKAGECGFCKDNDSRCFYTGLSIFANQIGQLDSLKSDLNLPLPPPTPPIVDDDDDQFNDEDNNVRDLSSNQVKQQQQQDNKVLQRKSMDEYSRGKHFMRSGAAPVTCTFHYQIVVAVKKKFASQLKNPSKTYYYLHIPLELSGKLTDEQGNRLNDRLVQVSHKIDFKSAAYSHLTTTYMDALAAHDQALAFKTEDRLEFYTALITFEPIINDDKCSDDPTNGAGRDDKWQICNALDNIREARLWTSNSVKLNSVAWVGVNYMSGPNYEQRMKQSYVFRRDLNEPVKSRAEIDHSSRAQLANTQPNRPDSLSKRVEDAAKSLDCLLSVFDQSDNNETRKNFKCNRSGKELKYAIDLQPSKLG